MPAQSRSKKTYQAAWDRMSVNDKTGIAFATSAKGMFEPMTEDEAIKERNRHIEKKVGAPGAYTTESKGSRDFFISGSPGDVKNSRKKAK